MESKLEKQLEEIKPIKAWANALDEYNLIYRADQVAKIYKNQISYSNNGK